MRSTLKFVLIFLGATICAAFMHELGHAIAGWMQGVAVMPTPLKEYILRDQIGWSQQSWISLGGVVGTILLTAGTLVWYLLKNRVHGDAVLAGVLLGPFVYTLRFILVGRGHDGLEWQATQSALGLDPSGHVVDVVFLVLFLIASTTWIIRKRSFGEQLSLFRITGLMIIGITVLVGLQIVNNMVFDGFFPKTRIVNSPAMLPAD